MGALPMTGVIVRSSANIDAGASSRLSTILHGCWLLAIVSLFPHVLEMIPRCALAAVLSERELDYVGAARLRGENAFYIMFVEILPNIVPPIMVESTVRLGYAIFTVATLSFLGFGIQPPSADWGLAISDSYGLIDGGFWWTVLFDAGAIASLVVGVNMVADGVHGAFET